MILTELRTNSSRTSFWLSSGSSKNCYSLPTCEKVFCQVRDLSQLLWYDAEGMGANEGMGDMR